MLATSPFGLRDSPATWRRRLRTKTDSLGKAILARMLVMSVATWYLIVTRGIETVARKRRSTRLLTLFWDSPSLAAIERRLARLSSGPDSVTAAGRELLP